MAKGVKMNVEELAKNLLEEEKAQVAKIRQAFRDRRRKVLERLQQEMKDHDMKAGVALRELYKSNHKILDPKVLAICEKYWPEPKTTIATAAASPASTTGTSKPPAGE
jgi:hypothetical protein